MSLRTVWRGLLVLLLDAVCLLLLSEILRGFVLSGPRAALAAAAMVGLGDALLTVLEIFLFIAWIWALITVFTDLFSDHEVSGWGKAGWTLLLIVLPCLGILLYLIARGGKMQERALKRQAEAKLHFDSYVRQTAGTSQPTSW